MLLALVLLIDELLDPSDVLLVLVVLVALVLLLALVLTSDVLLVPIARPHMPAHLLLAGVQPDLGVPITLLLLIVLGLLADVRYSQSWR